MADKRSIFEEVATKETPAAPKGGVIDAGRTGARGAIRVWLLILFKLVAIMVLVGGLTRLTDSGLSITEWAPIKGAVPPMSAEAWESEFEKYKQIPEFVLVNKDMDMAGFKRIYWWEWGHRQLGRVIGLVWALGFVYFLARRQIPRGWTPRLLLVGALGGLQGFIGWWMVSSGLTGDMVDVASYRLATHLGLAFIILSFLAWYVWLLGHPEMELFQARRKKDATQFAWGRVLYALIFAQIIMGALVAGIDAGRGYIDWPLMGGEFLPSESFDYTPFWSNFFENPALVQFNHRMLGYALLIFAGVFWWRSRSSAHAEVRSAVQIALIFILAQMVLGIITVMHAAPWNLAIFHQAGAIVVIYLGLRVCFKALYPMGRAISA